MQHACKLRAEQAVEVVKNHKDGTGLRAGGSKPKDRIQQWIRIREWTHEGIPMEGNKRGESHERRPDVLRPGQCDPARTTPSSDGAGHATMSLSKGSFIAPL
jgi:hypothetical protein